jgi:hypothetical protein
MKTILASAFALGLMTSAALAAPAKLTEAQMDSVKAGGVNVSTGCVLSLGLGAVLGVGTSVCTASSG